MIARNDKVILNVGESLFYKHGKQQKKYISQEMRLLARLVNTLRSISGKENGYLEEFLQPKNFDLIVEAAQSLSGVTKDKEKCSFTTPSVALKCGPLLKKCCIILKGQALRNSNENKEKDTERLQKLIEEEWANKVSSVALRSIKENKRNEQVLLPTTEDLIKLKQYNEKEITSAVSDLQRTTTSMTFFQRVSAAVLCRIIMFNRRRSGETSKMLLEDVLKRPNWKTNLNTVIINSMPQLERKLVNRLDMIEIQGKRGRTVPVILTEEVKDALSLMAKHRNSVGINNDNKYLFPRATGTGHIDGHVMMRALANKANLEFPERIGSTSMRKYIATVVQMLNLNDGEIEWLSNHLGHSIEIHKEVYRNHEAAIELGAVAKMLFAVDRGQTLRPEEGKNLPNSIVLAEKESKSDDDDDEAYFESGSKQKSSSEKSQRENVVSKNRPLEHISLIGKTKWTEEEEEAVNRQLSRFINTLKVPGKKDCEAAKLAEKCLSRRDWKNIKFHVYNKIQKLKK